MASSSPLRIGVGIDTARYGHRVAFLGDDKALLGKLITVRECREGYQLLLDALRRLHQLHPKATIHVHIDAAGQYAANLEAFLRGIQDPPLVISIGEPKRNKDYCKAHFPKRTTDDTDSIAMARFAVVETPKPSAAVAPAFAHLHELACRLQAQVRDKTRALNRLHNLLARVFPELALRANRLKADWVLTLLEKYPSPKRVAVAHLASLEKIPYLPKKKAQLLRDDARDTIACFQGDDAEKLVLHLVAQVKACKKAEQDLIDLLCGAFDRLPPSGHCQVETIPGIGKVTAAVLVAKIVDIRRFPTPHNLGGYFGLFPELNTSGVDKAGKAKPPGTMNMSRKGCDLVRYYLWNAARNGITHNPPLSAHYKHLVAENKRGDVALGHCMNKLVHFVHGVWTADKPFDPDYSSKKKRPAVGPVEPAKDSATPPAAPPTSDMNMSSTDAGMSSASSAEPHAAVSPSTDAPTATAESTRGDSAPLPQTPDNEKAAGHKRGIPAKQVVAAATSTVNPDAPSVNPSSPIATDKAATASAKRSSADFAFLREQISMRQVLDHLQWSSLLRGGGSQRRGPCPIHGCREDHAQCFSANLSRNLFQCFHVGCGARGNVLDFWAALRRLPIHDAALNLAQTFGLDPSRPKSKVDRPRTEKRNP